jgi:AraC family L-rhamnose operon regulatory protein RhaS
MFDPHALQPVAVRLPPCGVFVLESRHERGFRMTAVAHDFVKLVQPISGCGWLVRRHARIPLQTGDVVIVPPDEKHHIEDDGARPLSLYALCVAEVGTLAPRNLRHFPTPTWSTEFRALIRQLLHEQTLARPGHELLLRGLALQALGLAVRAASGARETAAAPASDGALAGARVAAYLREMERTFFHPQSLDEVAARLGLSRRRFTQLFRAAAGESWLQHLQRHRLAHARRLLGETRRSVASIGYECGFEDLTTFYRAFKAAEATSPLAWRQARLSAAPAVFPTARKPPRARRTGR